MLVMYLRMALSQEPLVFFVIIDQQKREIFIFEKVTTLLYDKKDLSSKLFRAGRDRERQRSIRDNRKERSPLQGCVL